MKVLMIDDEPLARIGMRSIVPWEENGFTLVGEARNGLEGLELARRHRPDLILVDIVMPEMDGLTFIREVKKFLPNARLIIMSCMHETHYLQKAIRLGVSEYILKDKIDPTDIIETVRRVAEEIRRGKVLEEGEAAEAVNQNLVFTEFMGMVLRGRIRDGSLILEKLRSAGLAGPGERLAAAFLGLDYPEQEEELLDYSALSVCQEVASSSLPGFLFVAGKNQLAALFSLSPAVDYAYLNRFFRQLGDTLLQCLDCTVTMGMSRPFTDAGECFASLEEARQAQELGFIYGKGKLFFGEEGNSSGQEVFTLLNRILKEEGKAALAGLPGQLEELPARMKQGRLTAAQCREVYGDLYGHAKRLLRSSCSNWEDPLLEGLQPFASLENFQDAESYARELGLYISHAAQELEQRRALGKRNAVEEIRRYVNGHIREKLSLESVARSVFLSPSYVCRIFKRETGENLQDYIVRRKLEEAVLLLPERKVGEVSDLLSFSSHSYFIKLFKQKYGATPFQYQKK